MRSLLPRWSTIATVDTRSLAAFRILLGLIIVCDVAIRLVDVPFFLSDAGALPVSVWREVDKPAWGWSVHALSGSAGWQYLLLGLQGLAALGLTCGWRTRWTAVLTWVLLISLQTRNGQILQGGDVLLRCLLFWGLFLPLGARWSLDARRNGPGPDSDCSPASFALLLQLGLVYLFTGLLKWDPAWYSQGTAVWYALQLDQLTTPLGRWLGTQEALLPWLTHGTVILELAMLPLAFCPWGTARIRLVLVGVFIGFHASLALCMHLGPFPFVCIAGWLAFIPSSAWQWLSATRRPEPLQLAEPGPRWVDALVLMLIGHVVLWNIRTTNFEYWKAWYPPGINWILQVPRLDQYWSMFSPRPLDDDGWYAMPATLADGTQIDLLTWVAPVTTPPVDDPYHTERWRKYLMNLYLADNQAWRAHAGPALVRRFEAAHPGATVKTAELRFWHKRNHFGGSPTITEESLYRFENK